MYITVELESAPRYCPLHRRWLTGNADSVGVVYLEEFGSIDGIYQLRHQSFTEIGNSAKDPFNTPCPVVIVSFWKEFDDFCSNQFRQIHCEEGLHKLYGVESFRFWRSYCGGE